MCPPASDDGHPSGASGSDEGHVVVVGAGVVGCAIAAALSRSVSVTVLEKGPIGAGTTARAAGEVTMTPSYSDYPAIADYANSFFREHAGPRRFAFHDRESVEFVPPDRLGESRRRVERLSNDGIPVSFLNAVDASIAYPPLDLDRYVGLVRHADAGFLDPERLTGCLARRAVRRGARIETGVEVTDLQVSDGRIVGVRSDAGPLRADAVVVAAGWRTPRLLGDRLALPVRPYRTQAVVLELPGLAESSTPLPMGWVPEERVYFRPMSERELLVGGWAEPLDDPDAASQNEDAAFRRHVAAVVPKLFADPSGARYVEGWAGVDLATPDTRPIIDVTPDGPAGLFLATGFHGRGVMTAPVAGAAIRSLVLGEPAPFLLDPFRVDRFADRSPDFPFLSTSAGGEPDAGSE